MLDRVGQTLVCAGLVACGAPSAKPERSALEPARALVRESANASAEAPRCRDAWAASPKTDWRYDFGRDARWTARGNEGYQDYAARVNRTGCVKDWTVLIYMAADVGDLEPFAVWNIHDMEMPLADGSAASTVDADVVVELDLAEPRGVRRMHLFTHEQGAAAENKDKAAREHFVGRSKVARLSSPIVEYAPDEPQDPAAALRAFVDWGLRSYPADRVMLVVWGHGAGWRASDDRSLKQPCPEAPSSAVDFLAEGGFGPDCSEGTVLDIPSLAKVVGEVALERRGSAIDVLVTDACLMQTVEITTELADAARYIVGYEQVGPHAGMPYLRLIPGLNGSVALPGKPDPRCGPIRDLGCEVAASVPAIYRAAVEEGFYSERIRGTTDAPVSETYTVSTVDTLALKRSLVPAMDELGDALVEFLDEEPPRTILVHELLRPGGLRGFAGETRDLGMVLTRLAQIVDEAELLGATLGSQRLRTAIARAEAALELAVLRSAHGSDYRGPQFPDGFGGLAVWLPRCESSLLARLGEFQRSSFYESLAGAGHPWERWLELSFGPQPDCD
ncbi:Clostripain family protein [Enhygromyxa salina]|uniref:Clostripain family protein n=1 Tax=Enhygromyxa salina TaxID=215803 RepID=A0A2S9YAR2_9BACT|nr:clostripain-related cysteine peptidase [Enhygromyxa salina]PRQ02193.1 Clostripain family protein [Enhygromyxa salina]